MLNFLKQPRQLICCFNYLILGKNHRLITTMRSLVVNYSSQVMFTPKHNSNLLLSANQVRLVLLRNKSKNRKKAQKYEEEESSDEEDGLDDDYDDDDFNDENVKSISVKSLRIDAILKKSFNFSRKKIEKDFYENRIRKNGSVLHKISVQARVNDVIDLIIGFVKDSSNHISVHRVQILKAEPNPDNDTIHLKVRWVKSTQIENYPDGHPWKQPVEED